MYISQLSNKSIWYMQQKIEKETEEVKQKKKKKEREGKGHGEILLSYLMIIKIFK